MTKKFCSIVLLVAISLSITVINVSAEVMLAKPTVAVTLTGKNPTIKWKSVKNADSYLVYRLKIGTTKYTKIAETKKLSYTDTDVKSTTIQKYMIIAKDKKGNKSERSSAITTISTIKNIKATPTEYGVKLTWSKAANAVSYVVEQAIGGGKYKTLTTTKKTSIDVTNLYPNTSYKYRIRAKATVGGKNFYGLPSSVVMSTESLPPSTPDPDTTTVNDPDPQPPVPDIITPAPEFITIAGMTIRTDITELTLTNKKLTNISDLRWLRNLTFLDLGFNNITDLTPIQGLTNLKSLFLYGNSSLSDITPLSNLSNLNTLNLGFTIAEDLTPLKYLPRLRYLYIGEVCSDLTPLANIKSLTCIRAGNCNISDVTPLANLTNLTELTLFDNNISDISCLKNLINLTELDLSGNNISDISVLKNFLYLKQLDINGNNVSDISVLSELSYLFNIDIRNNNITSIEPLLNLRSETYLYVTDSNSVINDQIFNGLKSEVRVFTSDNQVFAWK